MFFWVACQLFSNEVHFYDSIYSTVSAETLDVLAQLIRTDQKTFTVKVMNTLKQAGSVDCALYAMPKLAYLAFGKDPTTIVINQDDMRPHLVEIFEKKIISTFPIKKKRKPVNSVAKVLTCKVFCNCRLTDMGKMICCNKCLEWFHIDYIKSIVPSIIADEEWYCMNCASL